MNVAFKILLDLKKHCNSTQCLTLFLTKKEAQTIAGRCFGHRFGIHCLICSFLQMSHTGEIKNCSQAVTGVSVTDAVRCLFTTF